MSPNTSIPELRGDLRAVYRSLLHWRQDHKKLKLFGGVKPFAKVFNNEQCPMCQRHRTEHRVYGHKHPCGRCPLDCTMGSAFGKAWFANVLPLFAERRRKKFNSAREQIVGTLLDEQLRLESLLKEALVNEQTEAAVSRLGGVER